MAFLLEQVDEVGSDVALMAGDEDFHGVSLSRGLWIGGRTCGSDGPGGLAGGPELVQVFEVALGVHAGPEAAMLEHAELAVAGEADRADRARGRSSPPGKDRAGNRGGRRSSRH